jgi:hypothetical protein
VVVLVALGALSFGSVALAQEDYPPSPPGGNILPEAEGRGNSNSNDPNGGVLPFTGGQFLLVIAAGAGLIVIGTLTYRRARARTDS